jgi:nonsense-mediated mRNA decay protein 3
MLCVNCGKNKIKRNGLCEECLLEQCELFRIKKFEIILCDCGSILIKGKWKKFSNIEKALEYLVKSNIKSEHKITKLDIKTKILDSKVAIKITAYGRIQGYKKTKVEIKDIVTKLDRRLCTECIRKRGGYYEALLQVRVSNQDEIMKIIEKYTNDISNIKPIHGGIDIFFMRKGTARKVSRILKKIGYKIKTSYKLMGMKNGKKIYRDYYSVREKEK